MSTSNALHKGQIIDILAEGTGLTKVETAAVLDGFLATISWALGNGKRVALRGFGTFRAERRSARRVKSPQSGETILVDAHNAVVFRPSKDLRNVVNKGLIDRTGT